MMYRLASLLGVVVLPLSAAPAQIIPVKSVPIAEGDQFTFLPSANRGMANVSIALADSLYDPFVNPANGVRGRGSYFFASPSVYALSRRGSSGSTLPVGGLIRSGSLFAAGGFALQKLNPPRTDDRSVVALSSTIAPVTGELESHTNRYLYGLMGVGERGLMPALGVSIFWSRLDGVEGTELLYPGSQRLRQQTDVVTVRAGATRQLGARQTLEATLVHRRHASSHDVHFSEFVWDPVLRVPRERIHIDHNFERHHLWGLQLQHRRRLADSNWTIGALVIANRSRALARPPLGMMSIARDPGESSALNAGIGAARVAGRATLAADAVFEPIWSTGHEADQDVHYRFANAILRGGAGYDVVRQSDDVSLRLQAGMQLRAVNYWRDRIDLLLMPSRSHRTWKEWQHSWGMILRSADFDVNYQGRVQSGESRPGFPEFVPVALEGPGFSSFAPQPALVPIRVTTHQLFVSVPVR